MAVGLEVGWQRQVRDYFGLGLGDWVRELGGLAGRVLGWVALFDIVVDYLVDFLLLYGCLWCHWVGESNGSIQGFFRSDFFSWFLSYQSFRIYRF